MVGNAGVTGGEHSGGVAVELAMPDDGSADSGDDTLVKPAGAGEQAADPHDSTTR
jgi:hypothetical protein